MTVRRQNQIWEQYGANMHPKTDSQKVLPESTVKFQYISSFFQVTRI